MSSPLSVVNSGQNYQSILECVSNTPITNIVTEVVLGKIPTLSKPALVGYQVADNSFELDYSLLGGLSISAITIADPHHPIGLGLSLIIGSASIVHTGIKWNETRNKGITSKNIALLLKPVFSDLNKFINQKTNEALKEGKVDKIDLLRDEFKTILFTKVNYMRDIYLMNGFTKDSVNIILDPFEANLVENIQKIETSKNAPLDTNKQVPVRAPTKK
jgi:hypothetical protein